MKKLLSALALTFAAHSASAIVITQYTNEAAFNAATNGLVVEDFNAEANGSFSSRDFGDFQLDLVNPYRNNRPSIVNGELRLQVWNSSSILNMTFDSAVNALGFNWRNTDGSGDDIEIIVGGQSITFGRDRRSGFFGITTDQLFSVAGFSDTAGNGGALGYGFIDNVKYTATAVPEPSTILLFGLGLLGLGVSRRRLKS